MKYSIAALALICAAGAAVAAPASNVTLYGTVEAGVMAQRAQTESDTTIKEVSNAIAASIWGIKGQEQLGNGYSVGFILEQGFDTDTGAFNKGLGTTRAFGRETNLYVTGPFGKLAMGHLGSLGFFQSTGILKGSVFGVAPGNSSAFNKGRGLSFGRVDNALSYTSPSMGGVTLHVMYSNAMGRSEPGDDEKKSWAHNDHYYGIGAKYQSKDADGSIIFEASDGKDATKDVDGAGHHQPEFRATIGGSYNLGSFRPFAIYQYFHKKYGLNQNAAALGVSAPAAGGLIKAQVRYIGTTGIAKVGKYNNTKSNEWTLGLEYDYSLSKRTRIWTFGGYSHSTGAYKHKAYLEAAKKTTNAILYGGWHVGVGLVNQF